MKSRFYIRNGVVWVSMAGAKVRRTTRVRVQDQWMWSKKQGRFVGGSPEEGYLNERFHIFQAHLGELDEFALRLAKRYYEKWMDELHPKRAMSESKGFISAMRRAMDQGSQRESRRRQWESAIGLYAEYISTWGDISPEEMDIDSYQDRTFKRTVKNEIKEHFDGFRDFLSQKSLAIATQKIYLGCITATARYLNKEEFIRMDIEFSIPTPVVNKVTIPYDRLGEMLRPIELDIDSEQVKATQLMLAIQLATTWRYNEVVTITDDNLYRDISGACYLVNTGKGGSKVEAPIHKNIYNRIKERGVLAPGWRTIKPATVLIYYNDCLREIAKRVLGDMKIPFYRQDSDGGIHVLQEPMWMHITSHKLRKTAINFYEDEGIPENYVKWLTGHIGGSDAYHRHYRKLSREAVMDAVMPAQCKLLGLAS